MDPQNAARFLDTQLYIRATAEQRDHCAVLGDAWRWFLGRYHARIIRASRRLWWLEPDDREQELWTYLLPRIDRLTYQPSRGSLDACIAVLCRHAVHDAQRRAIVVLTAPWDEQRARQLPDERRAFTVDVEREELCSGVRAALDALRAAGAADDAELLRLRWIEWQALAEIARALNVHPDVMRPRHRRACEKLRALLLRDPWRNLLPE